MKNNETKLFRGPIVAMIVFVLILGTIFSLYRDIKPVYAIKSGDPIPEASEFGENRSDLNYEGTLPQKLLDGEEGYYIVLLKDSLFVRPVIINVTNEETWDAFASGTIYNPFAATAAYACEIDPTLINLNGNDEEEDLIPDKDKINKTFNAENNTFNAENKTLDSKSSVEKHENDDNEKSLVIYNPFQLPEGVIESLTDSDKEILGMAYNKLISLGYGSNSFRYKAIKLGATMLHWGYSREERYYYTTNKNGKAWGKRDCSSLTYSCFVPFTSFFTNLSNGTNTEAIYREALAKDNLIAYDDVMGKIFFSDQSEIKFYQNDSPKTEQIMPIDVIIDKYLENNDVYNLKPGDIILCTGNTSRTLCIGHAMIYLGNGYVMHANGGIDWENDGIHIEHFKRWNISGALHPDVTAPLFIISIPDEYDNGADWNLSYRSMNYDRR